MELIASSGSSAVSLADVGGAAGYSRGIVTHAFGTRAELLRRVVMYAQQAFVPPETEARGLGRLLEMLDAYLDHVVRQPASARAFLLMWSEAAAPNSQLRIIFAERDAAFARLLQGYVLDGIHDGSIRADVDADAAGDVLLAQLRASASDTCCTKPQAPK